MKNVLIITAGSTPQIVTETVWALVKRDDPFVPNIIHLVTTADGRLAFNRELLTPGGRFEALCHDLHIPVPDVGLHLPKHADGSELADIRTGEECAAFANTVSGLIATHAADPNTRIHVSLAGGRKTMSYFAGAAISLFGRDQDELSHVLIEPPEFERCKDFWYPTQPEPFVGETKAFRPPDAHIVICDIPFLHLSHIPPQDLFGKSGLNYFAVLRHAQESLRSRHIRLLCTERKLCAGKFEVQLGNREFALYRLLAVARLENWVGAGPEGDGSDHQGWLTYDQLLNLDGEPLRRFFEFYDAAYRSGTERADNFHEFVDNKLSCGLRNEVIQPFSQARSKLNKQIADKVDNPLVRARLSVASEGKNPTRIGLSAMPDEIEIVDGWE